LVAGLHQALKEAAAEARLLRLEAHQRGGQLALVAHLQHYF
jgi:hypothetical protein